MHLSGTSEVKIVGHYETSIFHLHNASAARELTVEMDDQHMRHQPNPVYLDVTLDRTLSYKST